MRKTCGRRFVAVVAILHVTLFLSTSCSPAGGAKQQPETAGKPLITVGIYDRGTVPTEEGTVAHNRWTRWINEHSPVAVKFIPIPRGESVQRYKALFASGNAPDLVLDFDSSFLAELVADGQVIPIDDLVERHSTEYKKLLEQYPLVRKLATEPDGNMYLIAQITGLKTNHSLLIRDDWLEALGLEAPQTAEQLFEVAKAFAFSDPDGNGRDDTLGINFTGLGPLLNNKIAGGIRPLDMMFRNVGYLIENGQVVRAWEQAQAALAYQKRLYESGVIDPDFMTDKDGEKAKLDFVNGKLGIFWVSSGIEDAYPLLQSLLKHVPTARVKAIPLPKGPFGQFNPLAKAPVQLVGAINKNASNPEAVMKYIDFMVSEKALTALRFGIEGEHFERTADGCYRYIDREKYNREMSWTLDLYMPSARVILGKCNSLASSLDPTNPIDKQYMEIEADGEKYSLNPDVEFAYPVWNWPTLPKGLQMSMADGIYALTDIYYRAIVDPAYSVEQAIADARQAWEQSGGTKADEYYRSWFAKNRERVLLSNEYYSIR